MSQPKVITKRDIAQDKNELMWDKAIESARKGISRLEAAPNTGGRDLIRRLKLAIEDFEGCKKTGQPWPGGVPKWVK